MIKAGALYFAVFLSFIIGVICTFFILSAHLNNQIFTFELQKERVLRDVNSGISLVLGAPDIISYNSPQKIDLYNDEMSNVVLSKKRWGVYTVISASSKWKNIEYSKTAFSGEDIFSSENTGLYLTDLDRYLSISGNTKLSGTCYLPKLGIRSAYIEGKGYRGDNLVYGTVKTSNNKLPGINKDLINSVIKYWSGEYDDTDSVMAYSTFEGEKAVSNSFNSRTFFLKSDEDLIINNQTLTGNIKIYSEKSITITKNNELEDIMMFAPSIYVKSGFDGHVQIIAADTIIIEEDCKFRFPSFVLLVNNNINNCFVNMGSGSKVAGGILVYQDTPGSKEPELIIEEGVVVHGQVYCNGTIEHKGDVKGSMYCNRFMLKTPSAYYENHLLDAGIDFNDLSGYFAGAKLVNEVSVLKIIKWVN